MGNPALQRGAERRTRGLGGSTRWVRAGARPSVFRHTLSEGSTFTRLRVTVEFKNGDTRSNRISRADLAHC